MTSGGDIIQVPGWPICLVSGRAGNTKGGTEALLSEYDVR